MPPNDLVATGLNPIRVIVLTYVKNIRPNKITDTVNIYVKLTAPQNLWYQITIFAFLAELEYHLRIWNFGILHISQYISTWGYLVSWYIITIHSAFRLISALNWSLIKLKYESNPILLIHTLQLKALLEKWHDFVFFAWKTPCLQPIYWQQPLALACFI